MKKEPKRAGTPRVAQSLGAKDPRARNAARLRLGAGLSLDSTGKIQVTPTTRETITTVASGPGLKYSRDAAGGA